MKRRMVASVLSAVVVLTTLIAGFSLILNSLRGDVVRASDYTEEEHIERVRERAKKRYIENGAYTSLEVYPLYDENDKLGYFLIELQPAGYVYVELNIKANKRIGLYLRDEKLDSPWFHHVYEKYMELSVIVNGKELWYYDMRPIDISENAEPTLYYNSPYEVADLHDERRYLLDCSAGCMIPAIKKGKNYYNLISNEEFEYIANEYRDPCDFTIEFVNFIYSSGFAL